MNRNRLTSECSLLNLKGNRLNLSASEVGWDALSLFHLDDVAWHESLSINCGPRAVAEDDALGSLHVFEGLKRAVSVAILPDGNNGIEHENQKNDEGFNIGG